ncbi:methyl-accepting chemotaxis protein, partial [Vibrio sp.]|nr:methyl-accepting chemotaxis protein [Vibrio sp.]
MKIKQKITLGLILAAIVPLLIAMVILIYSATSKIDHALFENNKNHLISVRDARKAQIEDYFQTIENQMTTMTSNSMVIDAMGSMTDAFEQIDSVSSADKRKLENYYQNDFGQKYKTLNGGEAANLNQLMALDDQAWYWQNQYIGSNHFPLGEKHHLIQANDTHPYNALHAKYHPQLADFLDKFGYYDIFLVDAKSGHIVYSVFKELDYATSLKSGPYANSGIARAYNQALNLSNGDTYLDDFASYVPSYRAQASFISSPIQENGQTIGVLIFQMPVDRIHAVMTNNEQWEQAGLGRSGETYLVGPDKTMRSQSRFLIEDIEGYTQALLSSGTDQSTIDEITSKSSSIGLQKVNSIGVNAALSGTTDFDIIKDYRDVEVLSGYTPLNINGLNWVLMSEIDKE